MLELVDLLFFMRYLDRRTFPKEFTKEGGASAAVGLHIPSAYS